MCSDPYNKKILHKVLFFFLRKIQGQETTEHSFLTILNDISFRNSQKNINSDFLIITKRKEKIIP